MNIEEKIIRAIHKFNMISRGDTVIVGVSGGADSVALLHFLSSHKKMLGIEIIAVHINHLLRGKEAYRDETFVVNFCKQRNIILKLFKVDIQKESKIRKIGCEECGRQVRYESFYSLADQKNCKIATAHTLSDNIETFIMNIIRGTGLRGLTGIPAIRDNKIIRPLIFCSREEIEKYCLQYDLRFCVDSSNLSCDYTRNKIRLNVVPIFKSINPSFNDTFSKMLENIIMDNDCIEELSCKFIDGDIKILKNLPKALKDRVIINFVYRECGVRLSKCHVDLICDVIEKNFGKVNIPLNFFVTIINDHLNVFKNEKSFKKESIVSELCVGEISFKNNVLLNVKLLTYDEFNFYKNSLKTKKDRDFLFNNSLDYDTISRSAIFRNRQPEDFFIPVKRKVRKKLKKFFNEIKLDINTRNTLILLAEGSEVIWIDGVGVSDDHKVTSMTKNVLLVEKKGVV